MNDGGYVLDASAVLMAMFGEPGAERIAPSLVDARISAVNLSEVVAKLHDRRVAEADIALNLADFDLAVVPFDRNLALRAGSLRAATRSLGLSLGDRACLATAEAAGLTVLTADRAWAKLELDIAIEILR